MPLLHVFKIEAFALAGLLAVGGLVAWATSQDSADDTPGYEIIRSDELEPFRSAFNSTSDHVRLILLVGPT